LFTADDHPIYREGLARAITLRSELALVGHASSGREALERIRVLEPGVAVLDIRMPDLGGLEVLHALVRDATPTRVVLLTTFEASALVYEALSGGAAGYVPKHAERDDICDVIVAVAGGRTVICPELQTSFVEEVRAREVERRVEVDQIDGFAWNVLAQHVEVVAVVEDVAGRLGHRGHYLSRFGGLCRERNGPCLGKGARQLGEDRQICVQPHSIQAADAGREQRPFVLEPAELPLDSAARAVELARALRVARDEGVQPVGLDLAGPRCLVHRG
jgi:two-component system nitrate/nitrite response regulator NarL